MNIAFLSSEYPSEEQPEGGLGNYIRKISLDLVKRGHQVSVFVLGKQQYDKIDHGIALNFIKHKRFHWRFHAIKALHPWLVLIEDRINAKKLAKAVSKAHRKAPIDILQTPNYKAPGLSLCHNGFFPVVCRCSSYQPLLRSANGKRQRLVDSISDWLEIYQAYEADAVFAPSYFIINAYRKLCSIEPSILRTPIDTINDISDFTVYNKTSPNKDYLLYFGTLNGIKGVDILISALPEILEKYKDIRVLFIGPDNGVPGGMKASEMLDKTIPSRDLKERVVLLPSLPKAQLRPFIKNALGVIIPSRVDNYPNACLEAFSLGIPVIGTKNSSLDEMIEDGKTGFLAENDNISSLQMVIEKLLNLTSKQREDMVSNIYKSIEKIMHEDRVAKLLEYYNKVLSDYSQL